MDIREAIKAWSIPGNDITIFHSLLLGILVTLVSSIIAWPAAYFISRATPAVQRWLDIIFLIPFMTPPYIAAMGWILFMQKRGLLEQIMPSAATAAVHFFSLEGLVLVMSLHGFPFLVTILKNAMLEIPVSMEESAAVFGASLKERIIKILFPLLTPSFAAGAFLIFVRTLSEYGTPATLGQRIGFSVFTTSIHDMATLAPIQFGSASALSIILTIICLGAWYLQRVSSGKGYDFSGRTKRTIVQYDKQRVIPIVGKLFLLFLFFCSAIIPWFTVFSVSFMKLLGKGLALSNMSFIHYKDFFFSHSNKAMDAMVNSLCLSFIAACIAVLFGTMIAIYIWHKNSKTAQLIEGISLLPAMIPGIVLSLGIMIFWDKISLIIPLYNTKGILLLAYICLFLPFAIQYTKAALFQISPSLISAARVCGADSISILLRIIIPLISREMFASWMMIFIVSLRELVAPSLMAPTNTQVISTFIMNEFEQGDVSLGMCMAVFCMILTLIIFLCMNIFTDKKHRQQKYHI
ncbi:ABC transporter permease [Pectinatus sottacetonis]|uniref:ABC transporter permease n=1 Tax=Pectinatus sottacetonis TaxID=1002795 RepID=UPI0018C7D6C2|nr:iron ABC transporter permease [Pectinatus sottacetonis]